VITAVRESDRGSRTNMVCGEYTSLHDLIRARTLTGRTFRFAIMLRWFLGAFGRRQTSCNAGRLKTRLPWHGEGVWGDGLRRPLR
jgi:hypothetical protein